MRKELNINPYRVGHVYVMEVIAMFGHYSDDLNDWLIRKED